MTRLILCSLVLLVVGVGLTIRRRRRALTMSEAWLKGHAYDASRFGWIGPRWRLPKERAEFIRTERLRRIAASRARLRDVSVRVSER